MEALFMRNTRNVGRKPLISEDMLDSMIRLHDSGQSIAKLAEEYGVSRQAVYKRIKERQSNKSISIEYLVGGQVSTVIELDQRNERVHLINYAGKLSERAFTYNEDPDWDRVSELFEKEFFKSRAGTDGAFLCDDRRRDGFALDELLSSSRCLRLSDSTPMDRPPIFRIGRADRLVTRTDTDGFQLKALSRDRKFFLKSQAILSEVYMNDWAVEVIASDICKGLKIPCVEQKACEISYEGKIYKGVCSKNFELDGLTFVSFKRLMDRAGIEMKDEFVPLPPIEKLKWCAKVLSDEGRLPYPETEKYMLDLAVIDCLVGNVDRHNGNFGLFFNVHTGKYEIPLIFDNGMGLFENDYYRDKYETFDEAMNQVYVSPYGEDPFDLIRMLDEEYDLKKRYPGIDSIEYPDLLNTPFAKEYEKRMMTIWRK